MERRSTKRATAVRVAENFRRKHGEDKFKVLLKMIEEGKSLGAIGKKFGFSRQRAQVVVSKLGSRKVNVSFTVDDLITSLLEKDEQQKEFFKTLKKEE